MTDPLVRDREGLQDFSDALKDHARTVELTVAKLRRTPNDWDSIAALFRAVHNIKGDAALCNLDTGVLIVHPIETLLSRLREGNIVISDFLAETILLSIDRLELATAALQRSQPIESLNLVALVRGLDALATLAGRDLEVGCADLIQSVTGFRPTRLRPDLRPLQPPRGIDPTSQSQDIGLFRRLAQQLDLRSPMLRGRSSRLLTLALKTNETAGCPIDPIQLEAACHFHDLGMMLIPDSAWLKVGSLIEQERRSIREHPVLASDLLARIPGWDEAAQIVLEHHEMPDGRGYPQGLVGEAICAGAKLMAIVDAFESVMLKQSHRGRSRSILRAVAEVNASPNQFAAEWMKPFNQVIRDILERS